MGKQGEPNGHRLMRTCAYSRMPPTPLNGAYCNALLFGRWSVRQKLNRVDSVQFNSVQLGLRRSVRAFYPLHLSRTVPGCDHLPLSVSHRNIPAPILTR